MGLWWSSVVLRARDMQDGRAAGMKEQVLAIIWFVSVINKAPCQKMNDHECQAVSDLWSCREHQEILAVLRGLKRQTSFRNKRYFSNEHLSPRDSYFEFLKAYSFAEGNFCIWGTLHSLFYLELTINRHLWLLLWLSDDYKWCNCEAQLPQTEPTECMTCW